MNNYKANKHKCQVIKVKEGETIKIEYKKAWPDLLLYK